MDKGRISRQGEVSERPDWINSSNEVDICRILATLDA